MIFVYLLLGFAAVFGVLEWWTAKDITRQRMVFIRRNFEKDVKLPSIFRRFVKRLTDIVLSLVVCLTLLPLLYAVLGGLIKLTSKGPIIFKQKRIGLFGKEFTCYKFRSMYVNDLDIPAFYGDSRITPLGRFIRKTHLDEFPQFFNVLIGDMSLVGPRPTSLSESRYFRIYRDYPYRLLLRPGITGLSQINSGRFLKPLQIIRLDTYYFSHCFWWLDIKIIFQTLKFQDKAL